VLMNANAFWSVAFLRHLHRLFPMFPNVYIAVSLGLSVVLMQHVIELYLRHLFGILMIDRPSARLHGRTTTCLFPFRTKHLRRVRDSRSQVPGARSGTLVCVDKLRACARRPFPLQYVQGPRGLV
jgi:hypothetical protein